MAVTIEWDNPEKTILRYRVSGNWTVNEYLEQRANGRTMMAEVSHDVCILNDLTQVTHIPDGFLTLAHSSINSRPANTGLAIFVSTNMFFNLLYKVLAQVVPDVPTKYLLVTDEAEAYKRFENWFAKQSLPESDV